MTHAIVVTLLGRVRLEGDSERASSVFSSLLNASLLLLLLLVALVAIFAGNLADLFAPGLAASDRTNVRILILAMLPLALTFGIGSYFSATFLAFQVPIGQEALLLAGRIAAVSWVLMIGQAVPLITLAIVLSVVTLLGLVGQWILLTKLTGLRYQCVLDFRGHIVQRALQQFLGFLVVALSAQVAAAYTRRMSTIAGPEILAILGFANSLVDPIAVILGKVCAFLFGQRLANEAASSSQYELRGFFKMTLIVFAGTCAVVGILRWTMEPLVTILYGGGAFGERAIQDTVTFGRALCLGLPFSVLLWMILYPLLGAYRHAAAMVYVAGYALQVAFISVLFSDYREFSVVWSFPFVTLCQAGLGFAFILFAKRTLREK